MPQNIFLQGATPTSRGGGFQQQFRPEQPTEDYALQDIAGAAAGLIGAYAEEDAKQQEQQMFLDLTGNQHVTQTGANPELTADDLMGEDGLTLQNISSARKAGKISESKAKVLTDRAVKRAIDRNPNRANDIVNRAKTYFSGSKINIFEETEAERQQRKMMEFRQKEQAKLEVDAARVGMTPQQYVRLNREQERMAYETEYLTYRAAKTGYGLNKVANNITTALYADTIGRVRTVIQTMDDPEGDGSIQGLSPTKIRQLKAQLNQDAIAQKAELRAKLNIEDAVYRKEDINNVISQIDATREELNELIDSKDYRKFLESNTEFMNTAMENLGIKSIPGMVRANKLGGQAAVQIWYDLYRNPEKVKAFKGDNPLVNVLLDDDAAREQITFGFMKFATKNGDQEGGEQGGGQDTGNTGDETPTDKSEATPTIEQVNSTIGDSGEAYLWRDLLRSDALSSEGTVNSMNNMFMRAEENPLVISNFRDKNVRKKVYATEKSRNKFKNLVNNYIASIKRDFKPEAGEDYKITYRFYDNGNVIISDTNQRDSRTTGVGATMFGVPNFASGVADNSFVQLANFLNSTRTYSSLFNMTEDQYIETMLERSFAGEYLEGADNGK